jgi:hypothetical protein
MTMLGVLLSCWLDGESCSPCLMYRKSGVKNVKNHQMPRARGNGRKHKTGTGNQLKLTPSPSVSHPSPSGVPHPTPVPPTLVPPLRTTVQPPATPALQRTGGGCHHEKGPPKKLSQQRISILEGVDGTFVLQVEFSEQELRTFLQGDTSGLAKFGDIAAAAQTMAASSSASVASSLGIDDEEEQPLSKTPTTPSIVRFNNSPVDFSDILVQNLDKNAFQKKRNGAMRMSAIAARVAKTRAVARVIKAIKEAGDASQQALALQSTLIHPDIREIAKTVGYDPTLLNSKARTAVYQMNQARKLMHLARRTKHKQGRCNDDRAGFVEGLMTGFAPSPETAVEKNGAPTTKMLLRALGFNEESNAAKRLFKVAVDKRKRLRESIGVDGSVIADNASWSRRKRRKSSFKIDVATRQQLDTWIRNHSMIVNSPLKDETLLVKDPFTGERLRKTKLLLCLPIRELHNDLYKDPPVGLPTAIDNNGKQLISDTMLRSLLPPELKPATKRHKQMCGCEVCLTMQSHQSTVNAFRSLQIRRMESEANDMEEGADQLIAMNYFNEYKNCVLPNEIPWHPKAQDALAAIMCPPLIGEIRHWQCVLRRCNTCPGYIQPLLEQNTNNDAPKIRFHLYQNVTKCTKHGLLVANAKSCTECDIFAEGAKKGKVRTRKVLHLLERTIGTFFRDHYLPTLERYAYHLPHVCILSKNHSAKMRQEMFQQLPWSVLTRRDYADRLTAKFNLEAQSDHFGNDRDLSIEGSAVEFHTVSSLVEYQQSLDFSKLEQRKEMHSHFSDNSKQDAPTTYEHMEVLVNHLQAENVFKEGSWMLDNTDGCSKQYRCGTALYLLALLAVTYGIVVDRAIGAPGHGKNDVDGYNAVDKQFLEKKMCLIDTPDAEISDRRMAAHAMVETASLSFADECARLCSAQHRIQGVKSETKSNKREQHAKMKARHYHVQNPREIRFASTRMLAVGFPSVRGQKNNGLGAMYNLRAEPDLGLKHVAVRRIPCGCDACVEQLKQPWLPGIKKEEQLRYARNELCALWPVFEGCNDWLIVVLVPKADADEEEIEEAQAVALHGLATRMSEKVQHGNYGAFSTEDPHADGYYIVQWTSDPYTLQEDLQLTDYDPPVIIPAGELVCDAKYLEKVPRTKRWYIPTNLATTVRLKQVVATDMALLPISEANKLPNNCDKRRATPLGPRKVREDEHDAIGEEIRRRDELNYEEEVGDESDEEEELEEGEDDEEGEESGDDDVDVEGIEGSDDVGDGDGEEE